MSEKDSGVGAGDGDGDGYASGMGSGYGFISTIIYRDIFALVYEELNVRLYLYKTSFHYDSEIKFFHPSNKREDQYYKSLVYNMHSDWYVLQTREMNETDIFEQILILLIRSYFWRNEL